MRIVFVAILFISSLFGAAGEAAPELNKKFHDSSRCKPCHAQIVKEWSGSYHAKSHFKNNEYLRKSMKYVGRKSRKSDNAVKVECATCHNPRIAVTEVGADYEIMSVMKLDKGSKVNKALESDELNEGINCLVCHNVKKVHSELDESKRGVRRLEWNKVGEMSGPYKNANSPYHKTHYRDFIGKDPKELCFVCHANDRSTENVIFTDMKKEYSETGKQCADCHMSPKKEGFASNLPIENSKPKKRMIREHGFVGAHQAWMWDGALHLNAKVKDKKLLVTLKNDNPHNIPSGFGARELIIDVEYQSGSKIIERKHLSLTRHYKDKRGKPTIPHLAKEMSKDMSIPANGSRTFSLPLVKGAGMIVVTLSYRLVNDEVHKLLGLKEPQWSEKKLIDRFNLRL
ncbi:MAG: hypothetical protein B5M52_02105 [Helicobacteraceae bacterium 4484_230]|nr:MAG: hypothetical protein B5M52_02105 [Helicobacteraceae bacterium 4484_230]